MKNLHFTTPHIRPQDVKRKWYIIDATNQTLGRLCSKIATILRGKHKAIFTHHVDCGDFVVVTNCEKVVLTGNKMDQKTYVRYSGYPGGKKEENAKKLLDKKPLFLIEHGVKGMLPKNRLGSKVYKKLFVYEGDNHPHAAQSPESLTLK